MRNSYLSKGRNVVGIHMFNTSLIKSKYTGNAELGQLVVIYNSNRIPLECVIAPVLHPSANNKENQ